MRRLLAVAKKELRQIVRDRRTLVIVVLVPVFLLLMYGYALNFDVRHVRLAVQDRDGSSTSRELTAAFLNSGYFDLVARVTSAGEIERLVDRGRIRAALVIPEDLGRDLTSGREAQVQMIIDGDNPTIAATVSGYAAAIVRTFSAEHVPPGRIRLGPAVVLEPRVWYNPELQSTLFLVPGLIAYIMMITAVVSTAVSIVREKERGTMEQIRMAPIGTWAYVAGKTLPYLVLSFASGILIIAVSRILFDLPMRGSWLMLFGTIMLFLLGALAQGLQISTLADTQQAAFQLALLSSYLPTLVLSGFIFPISSMPAAVQAVTYLVPARYFLAALRGIVLKGASVESYAIDLAALAVFAAAMLALASVRLRRQMSG